MIFKKGDKVYDRTYGWGEVCDIRLGHVYILKCEFGDYKCTYTREGSVIDGQLPTLSFTEYTLEGFSQEPTTIPKH
jgi:hypothetical protein